MVLNPTRMNPPRILDPIITSLSDYYQTPECLPPLDPDPDSNGKPSDHKMVLMSPVDVINNKSSRIYRNITYRPITDEGIAQMKAWLLKEKWDTVINENCPNLKAENFQAQMLRKIDEFFPLKEKKVADDDQPSFNEKLRRLKRKKCRIYRKQRKSEEWRRLEEIYRKEIKKAKTFFIEQK